MRERIWMFSQWTLLAMATLLYGGIARGDEPSLAGCRVLTMSSTVISETDTHRTVQDTKVFDCGGTTVTMIVTATDYKEFLGGMNPWRGQVWQLTIYGGGWSYTDWGIGARYPLTTGYGESVDERMVDPPL